MGPLLLLGLATAACASPGKSSSAPTNAISSNTTIPIPTTTSAPTTTAPTLPPPTPAENALLQDLYNVKSAGQTASASLTIASANQATGASSDSLSQITAAVTPVTLYLTTALNQLTAVIPTLPANALLTQTAQTLSSNLTGDLQGLKSEAAITQQDASAAQVPGIAPSVASASEAYAVSAAIGGYIQALGLVNETFSDGLVADFVKALSLVVNVSAASP